MSGKKIFGRSSLWLALIAAIGTQASWGAEAPAVDGEFVVHLRSASIDSVTPKLNKAGFKIVETLNRDGDLYRVRVSHPAGVPQKLKMKTLGEAHNGLLTQLSSLPEVDYAEPNFIYSIDMGAKAPTANPIPSTPPPVDNLPELIPNDPMFVKLWAMKNTGQEDSTGRMGTPRADIRATKAWRIATGSKNVVVAIVDTGIDYNHADLKDNVWSDPSDPSVHGYNAIKNTTDPMDDNLHGTHCAGTIGALGDNGSGVVGVNWHVSIMAVKFLNSQGQGQLADAIKAIDWAVAHGAQILSNSWGGGGYSKSLEASIRNAASKGVLFVAAAGNGDSNGVGQNNDTTPIYPAGYKIDNVIAVAASNNVDQMSKFSNFGATTVALMAPGERILSTVPGNGYKVLSGTSMATPHVSGAAALLLSKEPSLTAVQLKQRLISSVHKIPEYKNKVSSGGRLDLYNLITNGSN